MRAHPILFVTSLAVVAFARPAAADNYGAIAYSPSTGANGYSYDYGSQDAAESSAMSRCKAMDCKIVIWFRDACGAVAAGSDGYGSSWASTRGNAEQGAINECSKFTTGCATAAWACSSR